MNIEISENERFILKQELLRRLLGDVSRVTNQLTGELKDNSFETCAYDRYIEEFERKIKTLKRCEELERD